MSSIYIDSYRFGKMVIQGKIYQQDLKIINDQIIPNWWRKKGHLLFLEDIEDIIEKKPEILIIGTGAFGMMKVPKEIEDFLKEQKINVKILKTSKAVQIFNTFQKEGKKLAGAFHLTC